MGRARGGELRRAFREALLGRRSHDPPQVWPWQDDPRLAVASPVVRDGDVVAVVVTDSPTGQLCSGILYGWLLIAVGSARRCSWPSAPRSGSPAGC